LHDVLNVMADSPPSPGACRNAGITPADACLMDFRPASTATPIDAKQKISSNPQRLFAPGGVSTVIYVRSLNLGPGV
jgi:hypothetical protein